MIYDIESDRNNKTGRQRKSKSLPESSLPIRFEYGTTLIYCLIMLVVLMLLGVSLADISLMGEKSVRNEIDQQLALYAAESALADAELDIEGSQTAFSRSAIFSPESTEGFTEECGSGTSNIYQGLCLSNPTSSKPIWLICDLTASGASAASVEFGRFTGQKMPIAKGPLPSRKPRYVIELIADQQSGQTDRARYLYRITAIGFGSSKSPQAVVQSVYRKSMQ